MNITTLFRTHYEDQLLFNIEEDNVHESWSSCKLFINIGIISQVLKENNIRPRDRILILTENRGETYEFSLAIFNIGAIAVPLSPYIGHDLLIDIIKIIKPKCCFYETTLEQSLLRILASTCNIYISLNIPNKYSTVNQLSYADVLRHDYPLKFGNFPATQPALIIHTSGSQGRPKLIQMSHGNLFYYFHYHDLVHRQLADTSTAGELQKPIISVFHPSHLAAYSIALQSMLARRPTYMMRGFSPRLYLILLSRLGCRLSILVPAMYVNLLKEESIINAYDYTTLELCAAVGEPSPESLAETIEQTFGATYFSGYGLTECLPGIAHTWEDLHQRCIPRSSCGKLLFEEIKLVDGNGKDSNHGELWLRNPTVYRCYVDSRMNQDKINADGWLRTGDLFYRDINGYFYHKGRIDNMFVFNGKNIYPAEIESALIKHPMIENAIATAILSRQGRLVPAVLIQAQINLKISDVINFFIKNGPLHALPKFIKINNTLPKLGPGKIDRVASKAILQKAYSAIEGNRGKL